MQDPTNIPSLETLADRLPGQPLGIDLPTALIAGSDPNTLHRSSIATIAGFYKAEGESGLYADVADRTESFADLMRPAAAHAHARDVVETTAAAVHQSDMAAGLLRDNSDSYAPSADQLQAIFDAPDSTQTPGESVTASIVARAAERAEQYRARERESAVRSAILGMQVDLAHDILSTRRRLSRPARSLGTLACGVTFGAGAQAYIETALAGNSNITGWAILSAAFIGSTLGKAILDRESNIGRIAKRRALKQIKKAPQQTGGDDPIGQASVTQ